MKPLGKKLTAQIVLIFALFLLSGLARGAVA